MLPVVANIILSVYILRCANGDQQAQEQSNVLESAETCVSSKTERASRRTPERGEGPLMTRLQSDRRQRKILIISSRTGANTVQ